MRVREFSLEDWFIPHCLKKDAANAQEAIDSLKAMVDEKRSANRGREDAYGTFREDDQTAIVRFFD